MVQDYINSKYMMHALLQGYRNKLTNNPMIMMGSYVAELEDNIVNIKIQNV